MTKKLDAELEALNRLRRTVADNLAELDRPTEPLYGYEGLFYGLRTTLHQAQADGLKRIVAPAEQELLEVAWLLAAGRCTEATARADLRRAWSHLQERVFVRRETVFLAVVNHLPNVQRSTYAVTASAGSIGFTRLD